MITQSLELPLLGMRCAMRLAEAGQSVSRVVDALRGFGPAMTCRDLGLDTVLAPAATKLRTLLPDSALGHLEGALSDLTVQAPVVLRPTIAAASASVGEIRTALKSIFANEFK